MKRLLFTLPICFCMFNSCGPENSAYRQQEEQDRSILETEDPMQVAEKAAPKSLEKNNQEQEEVDMERLRRPHPEVIREKLRNAPIDSAEKVIRVECDCSQNEAQMQQTTPAEGSKAPAPEVTPRQEQEEEESVPKLPGRRPQLPPGYDDSSYKPI